MTWGDGASDAVVTDSQLVGMDVDPDAARLGMADDVGHSLPHGSPEKLLIIAGGGVRLCGVGEVGGDARGTQRCVGGSQLRGEARLAQLGSGDAAFLQQDYAVGLALSLFEVVGGEDDGLALASLVPHGLPELMAGVDVHARGGLIQDEQLGAGQDGKREANALLFAARAQSDLAVFEIGQPRLLKYLFDGPRQRDIESVEPGYGTHSLRHCEIGQQPAGLQHRTHP